MMTGGVIATNMLPAIMETSGMRKERSNDAKIPKIAPLRKVQRNICHLTLFDADISQIRTANPTGTIRLPITAPASARIDETCEIVMLKTSSTVTNSVPIMIIINAFQILPAFETRFKGIGITASDGGVKMGF